MKYRFCFWPSIANGRECTSLRIFEPVQIARTELRNRIVLPPMVTNWARKDEFPSDKNVRFYKRVAKGGVGTIITEAMNVVPSVRIAARQMGIYNGKFVDGLKRITAAVKPYQARIFSQLVHGGPRSAVGDCVSPSGVPIKETKPRILERDEIFDIIHRFVEAAKIAERSGFDGVELHAAHFYLLSAFLSPFTNRREDEFGGSAHKNSRIVREIIRRIKNEIGPDFPVTCRINAFESVDRGIGLQFAAHLSRDLEAGGADAIHASAYVIHIPSSTRGGPAVPMGGPPTNRDPQGCFVKYAENVKGAVSVPVIAVGKIYDPIFAEEVLKERKADLVALGRQLLADPDWATKVRQGRACEINWCVYCSACSARLREGNDVVCVRNSDLGK